MLQTLMCYAKVHIKNKIIRLNFISQVDFKYKIMDKVLLSIYKKNLHVFIL
jgi:hypothetical protein